MRERLYYATLGANTPTSQKDVLASNTYQDMVLNFEDLIFSLA